MKCLPKEVLYQNLSKYRKSVQNKSTISGTCTKRRTKKCIANMNVPFHHESYRRRRKRRRQDRIERKPKTSNPSIPALPKNAMQIRLVSRLPKLHSLAQNMQRKCISNHRRTFNHISHSNTIPQLLPPLTRLLLLPNIPHAS